MAFRSASWIRHAGATVAARVPPGRPRQAAIAAWLLALGAVGYMITRNVTNPVQFRMVDLDVYRNGALAVLNDRHLYSVLSRDGLLFTYPPAAAILAIPLVVRAAEGRGGGLAAHGLRAAGHRDLVRLPAAAGPGG